MKKHLVMAVLPLLAWGCGDSTDADNDGVADGIRDPNNVSVVVPSTPKGTVSGQVLGTNLQGLADVTVAMTIGSQAAGKSATTDANGNFVMTDVPAAAQVLLTFSKPGYATLRATSTVPAEAGTVPINNGNASFGPITLAQLNSSLSFQVVTPDGRPAAGAKGTLEVDRAGSIILSNYETGTSVVSRVYVEATADAQGVLTFNGVPSGTELARLNGSYNLWVSPLDANGDGAPETGGFVMSYSGASIVTSSVARVVNLPYSKPGNPAALAIESSSVPSMKANPELDPLRNLVRPGEPVYVYFNQPVQPGSLLVRLTDEYAKETLPVTATVNNGGYSATLSPGSGIVQEGKEYNVILRATSAEGGSTIDAKGFFIGGSQFSAPAIAVTTSATFYDINSSGSLDSGEVVALNFNQPMMRSGTPAYVFFENADLNASSALGVGEWNPTNKSAIGFPLLAYEPQSAPLEGGMYADPRPAFAPRLSNYSSRYYFRFYSSGTPLKTFSSGAIVPLQLAFEFLPSPNTDVYESVWGVPVTSNIAVSVTLVGQQPPTSP
ncbi:carboxypeptidase-like regulatory domain-containing protein [Corallococcus sp. BB11-1]|uniref:carboxypeptidase-like regulatory domain-containing protein n=1 Tax=Corallococcus sp. BB11-1 TaxID=2996783 RepID=UPI00226DF4B6|nr:carboxypeptidase-like regulatory domain-containing protein [Corallococcus sp. BB11-1]MCY1030440.1 carboxypeptidase-like regulatory domain-containing protein [Corallococcus sp. BB11-1]